MRNTQEKETERCSKKGIKKMFLKKVEGKKERGDNGGMGRGKVSSRENAEKRRHIKERGREGD